MYEVNVKPIVMFKRSFWSMELTGEESFAIYKRFANEKELIQYLYRSYHVEYHTYWFGRDLDRTGQDTQMRYYWRLAAEGDGIVEVPHLLRKQWLFAEERYDGQCEVIDPTIYQRQVNDLVRRYGSKKQGPVYRREPIPKTGRRHKRYHFSNKQIKHTSWYRQEVARLKMDKGEYDTTRPRTKPKYLDWNFYHVHSSREFKSWKNQKIQRQWMKHLNSKTVH